MPIFYTLTGELTNATPVDDDTEVTNQDEDTQ